MDDTKLLRLNRDVSISRKVIAAGSIIAIILLTDALAESPQERAIGLAAVLLVGFTVAHRMQQFGIWSPAGMFLLSVTVFHAGLLPHWLFGWEVDFLRPADYQWFGGYLATRTLEVLTIGIGAYIIGSILGSQAPRRRCDPRVSRPPDLHGFSAFGGFLIVGGVCLWTLRAVSTGGPAVLFGSYQGFLAATSDSSMGTAYIVIGLGVGLAAIEVSNRWSRFGLITFGGWALVAFFLGLRGEVLFPIAVAVSVLAVRGRRPKGRYVVIGSAVALTLASGASAIRQNGIANITADLRAFDPLDALVELGSTARVVATVVGWHDVSGEPPASGATYSVSVVRFVEQIVTPATRPPATADNRLFNTVIADRAGSIGGSVIAEAYHNFLLVGVVGVMLLLGILLARFGSATTPTQLAVYVCVAVPLFNHIRNSFVPVIPMVAVGLMTVFLVRTMAIRRAEHRRPTTADAQVALPRGDGVDSWRT